MERLLDGLENPAAARMEQEAFEVLQLQVVVGEEAIDRRSQFPAHEAWKLWAQHHAEAVLFDVPAHDVLGLAPTVLPDGADPWQGTARRCALLLPAAQHDAGCAIAEQGR